VADRDLAAPQHALRAAFETQRHVRVVVEPAAFDERVHVGRKRLGLEVIVGSCMTSSTAMFGRGPGRGR